jgi:hypothetical protein
MPKAMETWGRSPRAKIESDPRFWPCAATHRPGLPTFAALHNRSVVAADNPEAKRAPIAAI